jgi:hypothetical protein
MRCLRIIAALLPLLVMTYEAVGQDTVPTSAPPKASGAPVLGDRRPLGMPAVKPAAVEKAAVPTGAGATGGSIGRTLGATTVVIGLIVLCAGGYRWFERSRGGLAAGLGAGGRAPSGVLEVLGRYPVCRGTTMVVIRFDRRVLLLNQSRTGRLGGATFTTLCELSDAEDVASVLRKTRDASGESMGERFRKAVRDADREGGSVAAPAPQRAQKSADGDSGDLKRRLAELRAATQRQKAGGGGTLA